MPHESFLRPNVSCWLGSQAWDVMGICLLVILHSSETFIKTHIILRNEAYLFRLHVHKSVEFLTLS